MSNKFDNVPVESDTKIQFRSVVQFENYEALYEGWYWDGISAESLIFANEDIADISQDELEQKIIASSYLKDDKGVTIEKSNSGFTFVNFNFVVH
jgi:hypothetical protein